MTDASAPPPPPAPASSPPSQAWGDNAAPPLPKRGGCGKALLIGLAAIGALLVIIVVVAIVAASNSTKNDDAKVKAAGDESGIQSNSLNGAHPPQADIDSATTKCDTDALGDAHARGTLTNHSSKTSNYLITVRFTDASGTQFGDGNGAVQNVLPNSKANWEALGTDKPPSAGWKCAVAQVERLSSTG